MTDQEGHSHLNGELKILKEQLSLDYNNAHDKIKDLDTKLQDAAVKLQKMDISLSRIELAITGNPAMGHDGFAKRLAKVEETVEAHDKKLLTWGALVTGIVITLQLIITYIKYLFKGSH